MGLFASVDPISRESLRRCLLIENWDAALNPKPSQASNACFVIAPAPSTSCPAAAAGLPALAHSKWAPAGEAPPLLSSLAPATTGISSSAPGVGSGARQREGGAGSGKKGSGHPGNGLARMREEPLPLLTWLFRPR